MSEYTAETLSKLKAVELKALCLKHKYPVSGTKNILISRLLGQTVTTAEKKVPKKKAPGPKHIGSRDLNAVLKTLKKTMDPVLIKRNKYGYYEHAETSFLFSPETKKVIGKQLGDGTIGVLTLADVDTLNHYHFQKDEKAPMDTAVEVGTSGNEEEVKASEDARLEELVLLSKKM